MYAIRHCWLQKRATLVAKHFLVMAVLGFSFDAYVDASNLTEGNNASDISIRVTGERYSLFAKREYLSDILRELGKAADFKLKLFENLSIEKSDWKFDSMPLTQLLNNLLRDYNTVMLYEETQNTLQENSNRKLKELWLLSKENYTAPTESSTNNIEIQLEQPETLPSKHQILTAEQQFEITHIDNLEGLTSGDVIETLKQTLLTEQDSVIRKRAVVALGAIGGTRVLDALESGLGDDSGDVRTELARSFAGINHQRSMLALGQMSVGDHDVKVRQQAIRALAQHGSPAAHAFIEAALKDKEDSVKKLAREILQ